MKFFVKRKIGNDTSKLSNNYESNSEVQQQKDSKDTMDSLKKKRFLSNNKLLTKFGSRNNSLNKFKTLNQKANFTFQRTPSKAKKLNLSQTSLKNEKNLMPETKEKQ